MSDVEWVANHVANTTDAPVFAGKPGIVYRMDSRFLFLINFQQHMHSICVWNMIKQIKPLQTRYDKTHIYDRYYVRTHVYVFLFSVKKRGFELTRV